MRGKDRRDDNGGLCVARRWGGEEAVVTTIDGPVADLALGVEARGVAGACGNQELDTP
jgi:hypothetical protein